MRPGLFSPFVASVFFLTAIRLSSTIDHHFENLYKRKLHSIQFLINVQTLFQLVNFLNITSTIIVRTHVITSIMSN